MFGHTLLESRKGRLSTFGLLYISEGIPYGFTSIAMVAFMRANGVSLEQLGLFVATLFIPWSFKFAWAPVIDLIKLNRFGGRKVWIMGCQVMMILTLALVTQVNYLEDFQLLLLLMLVNNVFCATQDVAIDSLAVNTLRPDERASGNGCMFGGQYFGIALGGGAAIFIYGLTSFEVAVMYVSALQMLCLLYVIFFVSDPRAGEQEVLEEEGPMVWRLIHTMTNFTREVYCSFWRSGPAPKIGFLFSLFPTGAMVLGYAAMTTIPVDHGFSETAISQLTTMNTIAAACGCIIGGVLASRFGLRRMLGTYYVLTTIPGLLLAHQISTLGLQALPAGLITSALVAHGFLYGMAFGTQPAVFMGMTNPVVAATQFTAFMAMGNVVISYTNYWQGIVAETMDYATVLYIDALLIIPSLLIIPYLRSREEQAVTAEVVPVSA